jgi:hypothetical protein
MPFSMGRRLVMFPAARRQPYIAGSNASKAHETQYFPKLDSTKNTGFPLKPGCRSIALKDFETFDSGAPSSPPEESSCDA